MSVNRQNIYDKKDSLAIGAKAEDVFKGLAMVRMWVVKDATEDQNINEHWDYLLQKGSEKYRVDVKAIKRVSRNAPGVQDKLVWIELHGVRSKDRGWLYDGKADLISFEKKESFVIVLRTELIKLVESLVDFKTMVRRAVEAKYRIYSRPGRPDQITLVETEKLKTIKWDEWMKQTTIRR